MAAGVVNQEVYGPVRVETATGQALEQKLPQAFLALLVGLYRALVPELEGGIEALGGPARLR